jgi:hypothetical protein
MLQGQVTGTFHLATEAHWGRSVLPAGDYQITLPEPALGRAQVRIEGSGKTVYAMPLVTDPRPYSNSSYLRLSNVDGEYFVTEFTSGVSAKTYTFSVPKSAHRLLSKRGDSDVMLAVK